MGQDRVAVSAPIRGEGLRVNQLSRTHDSLLIRDIVHVLASGSPRPEAVAKLVDLGILITERQRSRPVSFCCRIDAAAPVAARDTSSPPHGAVKPNPTSVLLPTASYPPGVARLAPLCCSPHLWVRHNHSGVWFPYCSEDTSVLEQTICGKPPRALVPLLLAEGVLVDEAGPAVPARMVLPPGGYLEIR